MANTKARLLTQLTRLKHDCKQFDNAKLLQKNYFMKKQTSLFDIHLFASKSLLLTDYLNEIEGAVEQLPQHSQRHSYRFAVEKINDQIDAIIKMLQATPVWQKESHTRRKPKKAQYKQAVQTIVQSSQELYQELSQNHEFERRLAEMIQIRNMQLDTATPEQTNALNQEILALHARLGRCRKAITATEDKIQKLEKAK